MRNLSSLAVGAEEPPEDGATFDDWYRQPENEVPATVAFDAELLSTDGLVTRG